MTIERDPPTDLRTRPRLPGCRFLPALPSLPALLVATLVAGLAAAFGPAPAAAQLGDDPRDRLGAELDRTDQVLDHAREVVGASESERAHIVLASAGQAQEMARTLFAECGRADLRACEAAHRATTRARREALHAIQVAREQSGLEQEAGRVIERVGHLLDEALGMAGEHPDPQTDRLLDEARSHLERAREQYQTREFAVAMELALAAERLVRQALDLGGGDLNPERVLRELERTDRLLERASPEIRDRGNERAVHLLEQAIELQTRAHRQLDERRPLVAVRLTREARAQVLHALRMVEGPAEPAGVEQALAQTDELIERVESEVRASGIEEAIRLLDAGLDHQRRARDLFKEGRLNPALAQTRVARNLVLEAANLANREEPGSP